MPALPWKSGPSEPALSLPKGPRKLLPFNKGLSSSRDLCHDSEECQRSGISPFLAFVTRSLLLLSPHSQRIRDSVDLVEPRCNQRDLQNPLILKPGRSKLPVVVFPHPGRIPGELYHIVQHHSLF